MITMANFDSASFDGYDINLVQKEVDGGIITVEQIDTIREFPDAKSIIISGLKQDTFEYFVNTYGRQFLAITFWKNKAVSDLSALSSLEEALAPRLRDDVVRLCGEANKISGGVGEWVSG